jgi:rod shape-determining protein MreD
LVALVLLQVMILDNVQMGSFINPYPYIYLVLILPVTIGRVWLLLIGFALGLVMDMFSGTGGMHAAATTLIAYYRPLLLKAQSPREGFELNAVPNIRLFGIGWFVGYAALLTLMHHFALFILEVLSFGDFFRVLLRTLLSGGMTLTIMMMMELMTTRERRRK